MSTKIKNQPKVKEKEVNTTINNKIDATCLDVTCLINLYQEVAKANLLLIQILDQLFIDHAQMVEIKKGFGSSPVIWKLQDAKDCLEIIITNAALGKPQTVEYNDWLVRVTCAK